MTEYGGTASDFAFRITGGGLVRLGSTTLYVWESETGARVTEGLVYDGNPVTTIPVPSTGLIPSFTGPDDIWVSAGEDGVRFALEPTGGKPGPAGPPGSGASDGDVAALVGDPESETGAALSATIGATYAKPVPHFTSPRDYGLRDYNRSEGIVLSDFNTLADWAVGGLGTATEDTTYYRSGGKAVRLAVTTAGNNANISDTVTLNFGGTAPTLRVWVYLHDANCSGIQVFLTEDAGFTKYFFFLTDFAPMKVGAWNLVTVPANRWTNVGGASWSNTMVRLRFRANAKTGATTTVTFDDASYNPNSDPRVLFTFDDASYNPNSDPRVLFTFDDADVTVHRTAFPIMRERNLPGVVYVNGSTIGTDGHMTLAHCHELYDAGWDIASHGYAHMIYTGKTKAEVQTDIEQNRDWLIANGFTRSANHFAIPNSLYSQEVREAAQAAGVLTMRRGQHSLTDPARDLLDFPSVVIQNTTTVEQIRGFLDAAHRGLGTAFLMFHTIKSPATGEYHYSVENFQAVVDYIYDQVLEDSVVTASRWWRCLNRP